MAIGPLPPVIGESPLHPAPFSRPHPSPGHDAASPPAPLAAAIGATGGPLLAPSGGPLAAAVAAALLRQDGLAALFANLQALTPHMQSLPSGVQEALRAVAGHVITASPTSADIKTALAASGLFHEADALKAEKMGQPPPADLKGALQTLRGALGAFVSSAIPSPSTAPVAPHPVADLSQGNHPLAVATALIPALARLLGEDPPPIAFVSGGTPGSLPAPGASLMPPSQGGGSSPLPPMAGSVAVQPGPSTAGAPQTGIAAAMPAPNPLVPSLSPFQAAAGLPAGQTLLSSPPGPASPAAATPLAGGSEDVPPPPGAAAAYNAERADGRAPAAALVTTAQTPRVPMAGAVPFLPETPRTVALPAPPSAPAVSGAAGMLFPVEDGPPSVLPTPPFPKGDANPMLPLLPMSRTDPAGLTPSVAGAEEPPGPLVAKPVAEQPAPFTPATLLPALQALSQASPTVLPEAVKGAVDAVLTLLFKGASPAPSGATLPSPALLTPELQSTLARLQAVLGAWIGKTRTEIKTEGERLSMSGASPPLAPADSAAARRSVPRHTPPRSGLTPPAQGAASAAQDDALSLDPPALAARLFEEAERALARLTLHQVAALDERVNMTREGIASLALGFEIPLAGPGGISLAGIRIARDPETEQGSVEQGTSAYRIALSFAIEPLGPIHARLGLMSERRLAIGLWCETPESIPLLATEIPLLRRTLDAAGLTLTAVDVHGGAPPQPPQAVPAAQRLDRKL